MSHSPLSQGLDLSLTAASRGAGYSVKAGLTCLITRPAVCESPAGYTRLEGEANPRFTPFEQARGLYLNSPELRFALPRLNESRLLGRALKLDLHAAAMRWYEDGYTRG